MCEEIEKMLLKSSQETAVKIAMHMLSSGKLTLEEIAYLNGWISREEVMQAYEMMKKNEYGRYLKDVVDGKYIEMLKELR
mgnify:CR=1 FL=1